MLERISNNFSVALSVNVIICTVALGVFLHLGFIGDVPVGSEQSLSSPLPITVGNKTIEFLWTDNNADEDLLLYSDKQTYTNGVSHAEVYVAVKNVSGVGQNIELMGYFSDTKQKIDSVYVLGEKEEVVQHREKVQSCYTGDPEAGEKPERVCSEQLRVTSTSTKLVPAWGSISFVSRNTIEVEKENARLAKTRKSVENFIASKKTVSVFVGAGETQYFKLLVHYPVSSDNNFYIEAVGDNGAYGHLDPWFDSNWTYRHKLEVNPSQVDATHSNFPVMVDLSTLPSDFHSNVKSDGCDIRIVESDETTETAFELLEYDSTGDTGELYFLADSLSSSATTTFYVYYGNSGASCYSVGDTYGSANLWTDYDGIWHLNDPSGGATDSTDNNNGVYDGDLPNTTSGPLPADFQSFDGTGDAVDSITGISPSNNNFTFGAWFNSTDNSESLFFSHGENNNDRYYVFFYGVNHGGIQAVQARIDTGSPDAAVTTTSGISDGNWHRIVVTRGTGGVWTKYLDGTSVGSDTDASLGSISASQEMAFGRDTRSDAAYWTGTAGRFFWRGDDVGADWVSTEYNNQNSPVTFYWIGAQETDSGGATPPPQPPEIISF